MLARFNFIYLFILQINNTSTRRGHKNSLDQNVDNLPGDHRIQYLSHDRNNEPDTAMV